MEEPIENLYFNWLYSKVASVDVPTPSLTYIRLFRILHTTEFVWLVSGDDNRVEDGLELRLEFQREACMQADDPYWESMGCSVLEMLIALSRRAEWDTEISARDWFWIFLQNLRLNEFSDAREEFEQTVDDVLYRFVWRTYRRNGHGGIFPLSRPDVDQRKVEIWGQFCTYLVDQELN